ncbi:YDG/SRA domain-containing protein [Hymenobacter arizonensis]|uniref:Putative restriction endonuclease n=1 Tax=Hymenobacter arizonensis TaxID=1227077 RepID=A0A1I6AKC7_HYMAR|nr:YDG/SRA domain-containing protein [Hymenobacter arizonensis]SFQ69139.1 putative restriction endonuclease [Hymenobacter arizonensis]
MSAPVFGHVGTARPGDLFESRLELSLHRQHRPRQAGICATQKEGAESIVLSDKYEDDEVYEDYILYTGHGGRNQESGKQVADQTLTDSNLGLARSEATGRPVRVYRKVRTDTKTSAFRYEGLFRVTSHQYAVGKSGFGVFRFRLEPMLSSASVGLAPLKKPYIVPDLFHGPEPIVNEAAPRYEATTSRLIRDTAITREVKSLYRYRCQVCDAQLQGPTGLYAEAAHIRPLGAPHHGPDILANVLCFCPNHHVLFDLGSFAIANDMTLLGLSGHLHYKPQHQVGSEFLAYQRQHIYLQASTKASSLSPEE